MKIGIIVYSQTGNTLQVAEQLKAALLETGHEAALEQITAQQEQTKEGITVNLTHAPDASVYDMVYFAAPVQAFSLCPVMKRYLATMQDFGGRRAALLTTQQLPKTWMGGKRAIRQMGQAVASKGGTVLASGIVNWSAKDRDARIRQVVAELATASPVQV
ncbi:MAG: hypothetical protein VB087_05655 [Candidatus Limiplasma sp.]|nr:hypothetical protein [Candidatus Limiplasma sp.]MEA5145112.1 hypothetical protein [Candidatus Limiplasma sp.]